MQYILWECKNEVEIQRAEINKREAEQGSLPTIIFSAACFAQASMNSARPINLTGSKPTRWSMRMISSK